MPPQAAGPAQFAEFESIYAQQQQQQRPPPGMMPGMPLPPAMAAEGRVAAAPVLQVRGQSGLSGLSGQSGQSGL